MLHPTSNKEENLQEILKDLRALKFPPTFDKKLKENKLISELVSHEPQRRPSVVHILGEVKLLTSTPECKTLINDFMQV